MEIFSHEWTQGDTATVEEIQEAFAKRHSAIRNQQEALAAQKAQEKLNKQGAPIDSHRGFGPIQKQMIEDIDAHV